MGLENLVEAAKKVLPDLKIQRSLDVLQKTLWDYIRNQFISDKLNILVIDSPGADGSTLVDAAFEGNIATTGVSEPVSTENELRRYTKKGVPLVIYEQGLESEDCNTTIDKLLAFVKENKEQDHHQHIHVVWLCIAESGNVEKAHVELTRRLSKFIPVIAVITKAIDDKTREDKKGFQKRVREELPKAKNVVRVRAVEEIIEIKESEIDRFPPMGLEDLLEVTAQVLPRSLPSVAQPLGIKGTSKNG